MWIVFGRFDDGLRAPLDVTYMFCPCQRDSQKNRLTSIYIDSVYEGVRVIATETHIVSQHMREQLMMVKSNSLQAFPLDLDRENRRKKRISSTMRFAMKT